MDIFPFLLSDAMVGGDRGINIQNWRRVLAVRSYAAVARVLVVVEVVVVGEGLHFELPVVRILLERTADMAVAVVDAGLYCQSCRSSCNGLTGWVASNTPGGTDDVAVASTDNSILRLVWIGHHSTDTIHLSSTPTGLQGSLNQTQHNLQNHKAR